MKGTCFISILLLLSFRAGAQPDTDREIDSLKNVIKTAAHDTTRMQAYMRWDDLIYLSDQELDEELNRKIVGLSENALKKKKLSPREKKLFNRGLSFALNGLAIVYLNKGDLTRALDYQYRNLRIAGENNDKRSMINPLNNIGAIYERKGDCPKAIEYYTRCMKLCEETGDENGIALELNNIGVIYIDQDDAKTAMEYHRKSLKIRQKLKDPAGISLSLNNIGSAFHILHQLDSAIDNFKRSLRIREEMGVDKDAIATSLNNIGAIYQEQNDFKNAIDYFTRSLEVTKDVEYSHQIAMTLNNIGNAYFSMNQFDKAYEYSTKAFVAAKKSSSTIMIKDAALSLSKIYDKRGQYKDALEMQELYIDMRDSIQNEEKQKAILRQEMTYTYEKQKALDEKEHEKQMAVSDEQKNRQQIITVAIAAGLLLVMIFSFFVFKRLRITSKQKDIIEDQKNLVEEKQKEILDSITYAKRLQQAILPTDQFLKENLPGAFIFYQPKDIVAGDFYWMEMINAENGERRVSENILIAAADCTGHGVPGAMVSVVCSNALNRATLEFKLADPGKILDKTRELVLETFAKSDEDVKDGMDISLALINKKTKEVKWAGANNPLWLIRSEHITEVKANKQSIGKTDAPSPFTTHTLQLQEGDSIFLFTDGYADQFGGKKGKKFKYKPLQELLLKNASRPPEEQKRALQKTFNDWKGTLEQVDDCCIIGIKL